MSLHTRLLLLLTVVGLWARPAPAIADPLETIDLGAQVVKVADAKKLRATIDKGKKAGLKIGDIGELFPMRVDDGSKSSSVVFDVRIARGRVVELTDTSATIALEAVADAVEVGAHFTYRLDVSAALAKSELFRVTALGVELRPQGEDKPYITVEAMLADPSQALQDKALDAMITDVKDMKSVVEEGLKGRIQEGRYHGKTAGEIIDALDRAQLLDFLLFVEGFPGKYIAHRWKLPEVYFTWVISGTPSGEPDKKLREVRATVAAAETAVANGKLDEARAQWQLVLRSIPDHKDAKAAIEQIAQILLVTRTVGEDPDDTASRYSLADKLFDLGAYELSLKEIEALRKRNYEPFKVERMRGQLFVRQKKWKEAEEVFKGLVKAHPDDKFLPRWAKYSHAQARLASAPTDPTAHLELAVVDVDSKSWDAALSEYRKVLDSKSANDTQRAAARLAQTRIALQKDLDHRLEWARAEVRKHDIAGARESIGQALNLVEKLGDAKQGGDLLEELANLARSLSEEDLALELARKRVERVPDDRTAYSALAYALLGFDRIDEAEAAAKQSLEKKGDPNYAYLILSFVAGARDDLAEAEKLASKAATNDPKYAWPLLTLARAAAARGDWEQAITHAKRALALQDAYQIRSTHTAVSLGRQALEGLQANPTSARERLRLVRALAQLGLAKRTAEEIAKLPADGTWRSEAWWALADSPDDRLMLRDRLQAARNAKPTTELRKRSLALLEARVQLRAHPKDDDARIALAKLYLATEDNDECLATLTPLITAQVRPVVGDLVRDARQAIAMTNQVTLARDAIERHDLDGGTKLALAAQELYDRLGTASSRISAREVRVDVLVERGEYPQAIALLEETRSIAAADGDVVMASVLERQVDRLRGNLGTYDALEKALEDGRKLCEELDDQACLYSVDLDLASLDQDEGRAASAVEHSRSAWNIAERLGRPALARNARFHLADANLSGNRFTDAEKLALDLLVDSRKTQDVINEQYSLMVLGAVTMNRGQGKLARGRFQEVYELGTRTGNTGSRGLARMFEGRAWLLADHDPAKAAVAFGQADELYKTFGDGWATSVRGEILREVADALLQSGKLASARTAAEQGLALAQRFQRRPGLGYSQIILALIAVKEGKAADALAHAKEAVSNAEKTDDTGLLWNAWYVMARAEALNGHDREAAEAYDKAIDHLSRALLAAGGESQRTGFMSTGRVREVYTEATQLLLKMGNTKRAMEILEMSRDAVLKQTFDPTKIQTKDAKLRAKLDHYEATRARVNGLQKQLDQAMDKPVAQRSDAQVKALGERIAKTRQELNQVVLDFKATDRRLFQALAIKPENLLGRRSSLPTGSVLVEYFVAEDALYAFVIAAALTQPAVVRVKVTSTELEKTVADYRAALLAEQDKVKQDDKVEALGRKLNDWLLEPLRTHLDGASTVIILPFGPLFYVPFDALVVSAPGKPLRYAVEDYRISIQTATTLEYLFGPTHARATGTMLAVSNPDGSLPGAQLEVNRIVKTALPDAQVLGRNATVKKFRDMAGGFRYLHLATHGILDADPRKSFMKLSDGPLTVEMISQLQGLDQGNELVVLSACDTAVEKGNSTGDELVSIAYAFSMAGSPALVASLWAVSDDSTAELMATFYRALELNTGDRLDALRNAKLNVLRMQRGKDKPFAAPWHWSAFQLYGDFRAPTAPPK